MYSRFSKKEIVALSITGVTTFSLVTVLFSASASSPTTEDFLTGLENAFPKTTTGTTTVTPVTPVVQPTATGTTVNTGNSTTTNGSNTTTTTTGNTNTTTSNNTSSTTVGNTTYSTNTGVTTNVKPNVTTTTTQPQPAGNSTSFGDDLNRVIESSYLNVSSGATSVQPAANTDGTTKTNPLAILGGGSNPANNANAGLNSASQCKLPAIDILQVEELDTKTVVRWKDVIGAAGYDVMKRSQSGQFVFIERVKTPIYTAHLARGKVKYEDFKIAAVCGDTKSASINTSKVTSVKTGPVQLLLTLLLSMNIGAMLMLQKRFAFRKYFAKFTRV